MMTLSFLHCAIFLCKGFKFPVMFKYDRHLTNNSTHITLSIVQKSRQLIKYITYVCPLPFDDHGTNEHTYPKCTVKGVQLQLLFALLEWHDLIYM